MLNNIPLVNYCPSKLVNTPQNILSTSTLWGLLWLSRALRSVEWQAILERGPTSIQPIVNSPQTLFAQ